MACHLLSPPNQNLPSSSGMEKKRREKVNQYATTPLSLIAILGMAPSCLRSLRSRYTVFILAVCREEGYQDRRSISEWMRSETCRLCETVACRYFVPSSVYPHQYPSSPGSSMILFCFMHPFLLQNFSTSSHNVHLSLRQSPNAVTHLHNPMISNTRIQAHTTSSLHGFFKYMIVTPDDISPSSHHCSPVPSLILKSSTPTDDFETSM